MVVVVGAGTMGAGIAEVAARAGANVRLVDQSAAALDAGLASVQRSLARAVERGKVGAAEADAIRSRIRAESGLEHPSADLVVEAVPENLELKKAVLRAAAEGCPRAILASNTSSLSLTELAAATPTPERVLGLHFFNPPPVMALVEIVVAEQTAPSALDRARAWVEAAGKTAVVVRDFPGFATSRLGVLLGIEAIRMVESGVASAEDIDRAMQLGYRHPMGPLELTDLVGLDVRLAIADHLSREIGPQFQPPPLLRRLVRAGRLGRKTQRGFYRWTDDGRRVTE